MTLSGTGLFFPFNKSRKMRYKLGTQRMVRMTKKYGEGEPIIMKTPDSSSGIYVTASAEAELCTIAKKTGR